MTDPPIACTLTADAMAARRTLIDALSAEAVLGRSPTESGLRVRLVDTPEIERRTRELVEAESACCAFLDFELGREHGELVLTISGPPDARPAIETLFS